eukprot:SAG31_NODE_42736_length_270_cov_0.608187_1_plen_32_part_10
MYWDQYEGDDQWIIADTISETAGEEPGVEAYS